MADISRIHALGHDAADRAVISGRYNYRHIFNFLWNVVIFFFFFYDEHVLPEESEKLNA